MPTYTGAQWEKYLLTLVMNGRGLNVYKICSWSMGEEPSYTAGQWERWPLTLVVKGRLSTYTGYIAKRWCVCRWERCPCTMVTSGMNSLLYWEQRKRMSFLHTFTKTTGLSCPYLREEWLYATVTAKRCKWQDYVGKFSKENKPPQPTLEQPLEEQQDSTEPWARKATFVLWRHGSRWVREIWHNIFYIYEKNKWILS